MRRGASLGAQGQEDLGFSLEGMWSGLEQRAALAGRPAHLELLSEAPARLGGRGPRGPWDDRRGPRGALEPLRLPICPRATPGLLLPAQAQTLAESGTWGCGTLCLEGGDRLRVGNQGLNLRGELADREPGSRSSQHSAVTRPVASDLRPDFQAPRWTLSPRAVIHA